MSDVEREPVSGHTLLGVEIGGSKLQVVVAAAEARIIDRRRCDIDPAKGAAGILEQLRAALRELLFVHDPRAIGVGYGGPVDWRTGCICKSHHIEGWSDFPLAVWLNDQTGLPAVIDNDGNVAALGEAHHGAGIGRHSVMYVTLGSGVGAGLVINGKIHHGMPPGELELGHVRLNQAGEIVENRCSGWAVDALVRQQTQANPQSILAKQLAQHPQSKLGGEARHLRFSRDAGCPIASDILHQTMGQLAFALSHVVHLIHPQIIIIGGGLALIGEPLRESLARQLPAFIMKAFQPGPQIALATLAEDAVPVGAVTLAMQQLAGGNAATPVR